MADGPDELVGRIALGDHDALHALYLEFRPRLWRYLAAQYDLEPASLDDLLQEVFLAVWHAAPAYRPQGRAAAWIYAIARHHVSHARRDASRLPKDAPIADSNDGEPAPAASFEDGLLTRLALDDALAQLTPAHREVLRLAFMHGFSLQEIAQILEVPVGTVKSRISYARRALIREYATANGSEEGAR
ncbi:MAG TPA: RNA polymerase sigma factor [Ktedonobacterales bacterium]